MSIVLNRMDTLMWHDLERQVGALAYNAQYIQKNLVHLHNVLNTVLCFAENQGRRSQNIYGSLMQIRRVVRERRVAC